MRKILFSIIALCTIPIVAHGASIFSTVQISTNPVTIKPTFQSGAIDISSATIQDLRVKFGVKASTFTGDGSGLTNLTGSTLGPGNTNYINVTSALQSGATFYTSSGTVNALNVATTLQLAGQSGTTGQSIQSAGSGAIPTWVNVPAAILTTTSTFTAAQIISSVTVSTMVVNSGIVLNGSRGSLFQVVVSSGSGGSPFWSQRGLIIQSSQTIFLGNTITATTYQGVSGSTITIAPNFSTSKVKISGVMTLGTSATGERCLMTLARNGVDQFSATNIGVTQVTATAMGANYQTLPIGPYYDSPATTSATIYAIWVKSTGGGNCFAGNPVGSSSSLILEEIGQ